MTIKSTTEIQKALTILKGKTTGRYRINYAMIKNAPSAMIRRINHLYNNILNEHIPQYKNSVIFPIHKPPKNKNHIDA